MYKRLHRFEELVDKNRHEIEMDPKELERIERKIDEKHSVEKKKSPTYRRRA